MKIFLTGSEGFIGSHLLQSLIQKGHKVKALVQYNSFGNVGHLKYLDKKYEKKYIKLFGDIRDADFLEKNIQECDIVINLAALIAIPYSYESVESYIDTNIVGTFNVLKASLKNKVKHIIHTSTSEVYGSAVKIPIDENHRLLGQSPYAATKIAADQLSLSFFHSFKAPVTILRPFNTFGPRQSLRAVIPSIIVQCLSKKQNIYLGDISTSRDFNYVENITNAYLKTIGNKKTIGEVINIGSNYEIKIGELFRLIKKMTKSSAKLVIDKKRLRPQKSEVRRLNCNPKKAYKILKWKPKFAKRKGFIKALELTINWYKKNYDIGKVDISYLK
ncbi:SDR family NAD(P)-dependent oxidoreductase [Candidatus Pelagibacter sp.]|nr:SDR family NAD(P)-dependent oxidoreductase [Candidatus Pelagibacter sp.]